MPLEARNIYFRYDRKQPWILEDCSVRVDRGECLAISAPSGYGKTTLAMLLSGYIKPVKGEILLDGKALPIVEIAPKEGFYDYKNKYQAGSTIEICPAPIGEESTRKIQKISERVFDALRLHKYARMDFMMDEAGNAYCLEANTLPGMTPTSLIPQEAAAVGISYDELCQKILDMAFED